MDDTQLAVVSIRYFGAFISLVLPHHTGEKGVLTIFCYNGLDVQRRFGRTCYILRLCTVSNSSAKYEARAGLVHRFPP